MLTELTLVLVLLLFAQVCSDTLLRRVNLVRNLIRMARGTVPPSGRQFFLVSCSFVKQVLMQLDLSKYWKESAACLPLAETAR